MILANTQEENAILTISMDSQVETMAIYGMIVANFQEQKAILTISID